MDVGVPEHVVNKAADTMEQAEAVILQFQEEIAKRDDCIAKLRIENGGLQVALFCVENGLAHPDKEIRLLIQAAKKAREQ